MAKVNWATGISSVSGALAKPVKKEGHSCGDYLLATHRLAATTSPDCNRLYIKPADNYKRSTPVSAREIELRTRFRAVSIAVAARAIDLNQISTDQAAFLAQKDLPNGKKTMKSYLWSLELAKYDQNH